MGNTASMPKLEPMVFEPPKHIFNATGPNGALQWSDMLPAIGQQNIARMRNSQQANNNKVIHWLGTLQSVDAGRNVANIKLNPASVADPNTPDVIV